jgi:hypothetical protein
MQLQGQRAAGQACALVALVARMARIGRDPSARLGRHRWVVERTVGRLASYKRLALRYDRTATTTIALARLTVVLFSARYRRANATCSETETETETEIGPARPRL